MNFIFSLKLKYKKKRKFALQFLFSFEKKNSMKINYAFSMGVENLLFSVSLCVHTQKKIEMKAHDRFGPIMAGRTESVLYVCVMRGCDSDDGALICIAYI